MRTSLLLLIAVLAHGGCDLNLCTGAIVDPYARSCGYCINVRLEGDELISEKIIDGAICPAGQVCDSQQFSCVSIPSTPPTIPSFNKGTPVCGDNLCDTGEVIHCSSDCSPLRIAEHMEGAWSDRTYGIYIPTCHIPRRDAPIPAVLAFHGGGQLEDTAYALTWSMGQDPVTAPNDGIGALNRKAEQECFIAIYPNGKVDTTNPLRQQYWNAGMWNRVEQRNIGVDDVGFISALLDRVITRYNVDPSRVYLTGMSNGAMMTYRLACELSDRIAAIAPVGSGLVLGPCAPERAVPTLHMHGTADPGWPYYGGASCYSRDTVYPIAMTMDVLRITNSCSDTSAVTFENNQTRCITYQNCSPLSETERADVTFCTIDQGGHTWPSGRTIASVDNFVWDSTCALGSGIGMNGISTDINSVPFIWEFFKRHRLS